MADIRITWEPPIDKSIVDSISIYRYAGETSDCNLILSDGILVVEDLATDSTNYDDLGIANSSYYSYGVFSKNVTGFSPCAHASLSLVPTIDGSPTDLTAVYVAAAPVNGPTNIVPTIEVAPKYGIDTGIFVYPLFITEAESNYYDSQFGGTGTSHTMTYNSVTYYMPDNGGTHAGTEAPTFVTINGNDFNYAQVVTGLELGNKPSNNEGPTDLTSTEEILAPTNGPTDLTSVEHVVGNFNDFLLDSITPILGTQTNRRVGASWTASWIESVKIRTLDYKSSNSSQHTINNSGDVGSAYDVAHCNYHFQVSVNIQALLAEYPLSSFTGLGTVGYVEQAGVSGVTTITDLSQLSGLNGVYTTMYGTTNDPDAFYQSSSSLLIATEGGENTYKRIRVDTNNTNTTILYKPNNGPTDLTSTEEIAAPVLGDLLTHTLATNVDLEMLYVEEGTFTRGSPTSETGRSPDETQHQVTLTKGFYLGKYEVTQAQYQAVMTGNSDGLSATPSQYGGNANRPVETVSWDDAQIFISRLNTQQAANIPTGFEYALPTEAQWEYACRAGTTTAYSWGATVSSSNANYSNNIAQTSDVGNYSANPWGFFDMHGNVFEWVEDSYGNYPSGPATDPLHTSTNIKIYRGGSHNNPDTAMRSAKRRTAYQYSGNHISGFRVALVPIRPGFTNKVFTASTSSAQITDGGSMFYYADYTASDGDSIQISNTNAYYYPGSGPSTPIKISDHTGPSDLYIDLNGFSGSGTDMNGLFVTELTVNYAP